jgi:uncharacterized protein (TIGR03086 family)
MTALTEDYLANADRFTDVVDATDTWDAASPCEGWTAAEVVDHVVTTQRDYLAKQGADLDGQSFTDPGTSWRHHVEQMRALLADESFATTEFDGYFGRTTVEELLANFYGFDLVVHRWDLGRASGLPVTWSEEEMDRVEKAADGFGDMLYGDGVCKPALEAPEDAPRQVRLLARLGRRG